MISLPDTDPILVTSSAQLESLLPHWIKEPKLAVDTESNSLFAYQERVCLIQVSTPMLDYLIDPFTVEDLSALSDIFSNPNQLKIFHAAEYDLICLKRDYSFEFRNIFDTMVGARILGEAQVGLGSLLQNRFELTLDKHFQRANWGLRPLTQPMLNYARMDTHFLFTLQEQIEAQLKERSLWDLAQEDFSLLCDTQPSCTESNNKSCWKVCGASHITGQEAAVLQSLCDYRDQQAQRMNLPHFKVLSNELLLHLCQAAPHSQEELRQIHGITDRILSRHGAGLLQAIEKGENNQPIIRHPRTRPDENFILRLESLKDWRKKRAKELEIESDVVLPKDLMENIAARNPKTLNGLQLLMSRTPWRFAQYGKSILIELSKLEEHENII